MSGTYTPLFELTPDNQGGAVVVTAYVLIVNTVLIAAVRVMLARGQHLSFQLDDATFGIATVLAIASSACSHNAVLAGLGQHQAVVELKGGLERTYKLLYAADILSVLSMTASKASIALLFRRIAPSSRSVVQIVFGFIVFYFLFALFAISFQCRLPQPWDLNPDTCPTKGWMRIPVIGVNIATDVLLSTVIMPTLWGLKMARKTRVAVSFLFATRLIVPIFAIPWTVSTVRALNSDDHTWKYVSVTIWGQVVMHLSVITSTIPRTNSFWTSLQSGFTNAGITDNEYEMGSSNKGSKALASAENSSNDMTSSKNSGIRASARRIRSKFPDGRQSGVTTRIYSTRRKDGMPGDDTLLQDTVLGGKEDDETSQSSLRGRGGVWQTNDLHVKVEYTDRPTPPATSGQISPPVSSSSRGSGLKQNYPRVVIREPHAY